MDTTPTHAWRQAAWADLSRDELHAILAARAAVFVVEQRCAYLDVDGLDPGAHHLWLTDGAGALLAYARILPPTTAAPIRIGRVLTTAGARGQGLGRALMTRALEACRALGDGPIELSAQAHLEAFYGSLGFEPISPIYDEDGIPHRRMRRAGVAGAS
ncbi:MAG: GNAT family N-acetyltransferase [Kofleriaceae bacterium]